MLQGGDNPMNKNFEQIENIAAEAGFCEFKIVPVDKVVFEPNVRSLLETECAEHGIKSHSLPPAIGSLSDCQKQISAYNHALLVSAIFPTEDIANFEAWMEAGVELNAMILRMTEELKKVTKEVFPMGMRCRKCESCSYPNPCRHPESMLPATESFGIHIMNTMEKEGITGYYDGQTIVCFGIVYLKTE